MKQHNRKPTQVDTDDHLTSSPSAKILAVLLVLSLTVGFMATNECLSIITSGSTAIRFPYENTGVIAWFVALILIVSLSAMQKDIYWLTRKKNLKMDERQIYQRQQIFELSYKLGALLVLAFTVIVIPNIQDLPQQRTLIYNEYTPNYIERLAYYLIVALAGLPLVLAAWQDTGIALTRKYSTNSNEPARTKPPFYILIGVGLLAFGLYNLGSFILTLLTANQSI